MNTPPLQHSPLTKEMQGLLDHMAEAGDRALVRMYSQWWVRESDHRQGFTYERAASGEVKETCVVFRTGTVKGLVLRGLMRFTGPVVKGNQFHAQARAELTK